VVGEVKKLADSLDRLAVIEKQIGQVNNAVAEGFKKMGSGARQAEAELTGFEASLKRVKEIAAGVFSGEALWEGFKGGVEMVKEGIGDVVELLQNASKAASDFEMTQKGIGNLLRDQPYANMLIKNLRETAVGSPFAPETLYGAARALTGRGMDKSLLESRTNELGDIVSGIGGGQEMMERLTLAYGEAFSEHLVNKRILNQFAQAGVNITSEIMKAYGMDPTDANVQKFQKMVHDKQITFTDVDKALYTLTHGMGIYADAMQKHAETAQGIWTGFIARLNFIEVDLGGIVNDISMTLLNLLEKSGFLKAFDTWLQGIRTIADSMTEYFKLFNGEKIIHFFQTVGDGIQQFMVKLGLISKSTESKYLTSDIYAFAGQRPETFGKQRPQLGRVTPAWKLGGEFESETILPAAPTPTVADKLTKWLDDLSNTLASIHTEQVEDFLQGLVTVSTAIGGVSMDFFGEIADFFKDMYTFGQWCGGPGHDMVVGFFNAIKDFWNNIVQWISDHIPPFLKLTAPSDQEKRMNEAADKARSTVDIDQETVNQRQSDLDNKMLLGTQDQIDHAKSALTLAQDKLKVDTALAAAAESLTKAFEGHSPGLIPATETATAALDAFAQAMLSMPLGAATGGFGGAVAGGGAGVTEYGPSIDPPGSADYDYNSYHRIGAWPGKTGPLSPGDVALGYGAQAHYGVQPGQWFTDDQGRHVRFADRSGSKNPMNEDIFRLAAGGIVRRPTTALIGESGPEAVVPLRGAGGIGHTFNVTVNTVAGDGYAIAEMVMNALQELTERTGSV
jgi:hypothetical protein